MFSGGHYHLKSLQKESVTFSKDGIHLHKFLWLTMEHFMPFEMSCKSEYLGKKSRQQLPTPITSIFPPVPSSQIQTDRNIQEK